MGNLSTIVQHLSFFDAIDIVIVSIIFYQFLTIARGTKAVQMLLGMTALFILSGVSLQYRFYTLNWILSHFFDYFFLILIILFQDQIRSALINMGAVSPFSKNSGTDLELRIEEVVSAVKVLGLEKTGALIVFERKTGLLNYVQTGTKLGAEIHSDILYTLFQNNSPLHDGAVILSRNKIKAAGCFLPLTKKIDLDRHLGTRHRAGIGVTESTDAVVIIVSEETGNISVCKNGQHKILKNELELKKELFESLTKS